MNLSLHFSWINIEKWNFWVVHWVYKCIKSYDAEICHFFTHWNISRAQLGSWLCPLMPKHYWKKHAITWIENGSDYSRSQSSEHRNVQALLPLARTPVLAFVIERSLKELTHLPGSFHPQDVNKSFWLMGGPGLLLTPIFRSSWWGPRSWRKLWNLDVQAPNSYCDSDSHSDSGTSTWCSRLSFLKSLIELPCWLNLLLGVKEITNRKCVIRGLWSYSTHGFLGLGTLVPWDDKTHCYTISYMETLS